MSDTGSMTPAKEVPAPEVLATAQYVTTDHRSPSPHPAHALPSTPQKDATQDKSRARTACCVYADDIALLLPRCC